MSGEERGAYLTPKRRSRSDCLAAADAIEGAMHLLDHDPSAETLARLADMWRAEADTAFGWPCVWDHPAATDGCTACARLKEALDD